jgi:uncharacterized protein
MRRLDPHGPLAFDTRALGPGSARSETRTVPAPADLGAGMVHVPPSADMRVDAQLEGVSDGVLVTATVTAPLAGECARCLDAFSSQLTVTFQELFSGEAGQAGDDDAAGRDEYLLDGDILDLEPALRDALVLELPLSPLCRPDCPGLCAECGARLADAGPGHGHAGSGGPWAALRDFRVAGAAGDGETAADGAEQAGSAAGGPAAVRKQARHGQARSEQAGPEDDQEQDDRHGTPASGPAAQRAEEL